MKKNSIIAVIGLGYVGLPLAVSFSKTKKCRLTNEVLERKVVGFDINKNRIIDLKNNSGWIHVSQLKKVNSLIPLEDKILFKNNSNFSKPIAKIKKGRLLIIKNCDGDWCKVRTEKFKGWIKIDNVWGLIN